MYINNNFIKIKSVIKMKAILLILSTFLINIDQKLITTFITSALLTTLLIFLVLGLKKISSCIRIYIFFIV